jgi:hypothetical protein
MKKKTEYKLHMIFGPIGILLLAMAIIFLVSAICISLVHLFTDMKPY